MYINKYLLIASIAISFINNNLGECMEIEQQQIPEQIGTKRKRIDPNNTKNVEEEIETKSNSVVPDKSTKKKQQKNKKIKVEPSQQLTKETNLSYEERWFKDAEVAAQSWGQTLDELIEEANMFLNNFRQEYPDRICPHLTELVIFPKTNYMIQPDHTRKFSVLGR